jgi:hypothetical protein
MKRMCCVGVVFCALAATLGCRAPSPDWNGTWKLNPSKSSFQGSVLTISISPDGEYRFDEKSSHTLRCDGKDRPIGSNRMLTCVKKGSTVLDITQRENGVKTRVTHDELSSDGQAFTTTVTEFRSDGPAVTSQIVFLRLAGSSDDFAGQWRDTIYLQQHTDMTLRLDNQTLHIDYPSAGQQIDAPLNGVDAAVRGPQNAAEATFAAQLVGPRKILTLTKRNDQAVTQGSFELSSDGRVITDSWWNPGQAADKSTFVYEKK